MNITFEIVGKLKGKDRPRFAHGHVFTPKKTHDYESLVAASFHKAKPKGFKMIIDEPIYMELEFIKKKARTSKMKHPIYFPDIDNTIKIIMDGCNKLVYADDKQVVGIIASKVWGPIEKVIVNVRTLD